MKITNGKDVFQVTRGAYENIYKKQGFVPFGETLDEVQHESEESVDKQTDDEKFLADITEKPISQWSQRELRQYAQLKGIDAKPKELRTVVQKKLENTNDGLIEDEIEYD